MVKVLDSDPLYTSVNHQLGCGSRIWTKILLFCSKKTPVYTAGAGNFIFWTPKCHYLGGFIDKTFFGLQNVIICEVFIDKTYWLTQQILKTCCWSQLIHTRSSQQKKRIAEFTELLSKFCKTPWVKCSSCFFANPIQTTQKQVLWMNYMIWDSGTKQIKVRSGKQLAMSLFFNSGFNMKHLDLGGNMFIDSI